MLSSMVLISLFLLFLCLLLSAFFSSSETAFVSLQRLRLRHLAATETSSAKRVVKLTEQPERLLTTILLGNNFANTAAAALATVIAISLLGNERGVLTATITVTVLLLVFGEIGPKTIATRHGEKLAMLYAFPMGLLFRALYPIVVVFVWIGDRLARAIGGPSMPRALISEEELRTAISAGAEEGTLEETEAQMLDKVFEFGDRLVHEKMIPRPDIAWVEKGAKLAEFLSIYAQSPHSRFPVYEDSIDNVVGTLSIKDVLMAQAKGVLDEESTVTDLARPAYFVPETKPVGELFTEMQISGNQMVLVFDEYGGIAGLVTLESLIEEIVGQVGDELARAGKGFETIDENTFQISGGMRIEEANEELGLGLPEGRYETVAGFVLSTLGHIPKEGEQLKYDGLTLVVTEVKGVKIEKILVTKG